MKIVRTFSAGVFAGELIALNGKEAVMTDARRLWEWWGAATLSQLSLEGTIDEERELPYNPKCKFPVAVDRVVLKEVVEILQCTDKSAESINATPIWTFWPEGKTTKKEFDNRKIVRTYNAGVFFGEITSENGQVVTMNNARRLFRWAKAASLSEVAVFGVTDITESKFPAPVDNLTLLEAVEILDVRKEAAATLDAVPIWKM